MEFRGYLKKFDELRTSKSGKSKFLRASLNIRAGRDEDKKAKYMRVKVVFFNEVAEQAARIPNDSYVIIDGTPETTDKGGVEVFETKDGEHQAKLAIIGNSLFVSARNFPGAESAEDALDEVTEDEIPF